jgi:pimeloyl-ACP methyl ester carboxylesterase
MDFGKGMAETSMAMAPTDAEADVCQWLTADELAIYVAEYGRTGFQGGLNWYRRNTSAEAAAELRLFSGRKVDVPACFIGGAQDWGVYQVPGALAAMEGAATSDWRGATLIEGAGHWVQQEQPKATFDALGRFLAGL